MPGIIGRVVRWIGAARGWKAWGTAWLAGGPAPVAGLATHAERLPSVRLADLLTHGGRAPLGSADGRLDVSLYRRGVAATWFERPVVIDLRGWTDPLAGIEQTLAAWGEGVE